MWQRGCLLSIISFFEARHSHCVTVSASADRAQGFAEGLLTACRFRLSALPISGKNVVDSGQAGFEVASNVSGRSQRANKAPPRVQFAICDPYSMTPVHCWDTDSRQLLNPS